MSQSSAVMECASFVGTATSVPVEVRATVSDDEVARAILHVAQTGETARRGAGAAGIAALLSDDLDVRGETVMLLLCGGNLDIPMLQTVLVHAMTDRQQLLHLRVHIDDQPGRIAELSRVIADHDANIWTVRHERAVEGRNIGDVYPVFRLVTSGSGHSRAITEAIEGRGYTVEIVNAR